MNNNCQRPRRHHVKRHVLTKTVIIGMVILFLAVDSFPLIQGGMFSPWNFTFIVDNTNTAGPWDGTPEHPFRYIQDAIDSAIDGDSICVNQGTYIEHIVIDKRLYIQAGYLGGIIFDGNNMGTTLTITADNTMLCGFVIQHSQSAGILLKANHTQIVYCQIKNNGGPGVYIHGSYNYFESNHIEHNLGNGISASPSLNGPSTHNAFWRNTIRYNGNGDSYSDYGIYIYESSNNTITRNTITNNNGSGIFLFYSENDVVVQNTVNENLENGIYFSSESHTFCASNTITENGYTGIELNPASSCTIVNNTIDRNLGGIGIGAGHSGAQNIVSGNIITNHSNGIGIDDSYGTFQGNTIIQNSIGIAVTDQNQPYTIMSNDIEDNTGIGLSVHNSNTGTIHYNNFIDNTQNAYDDGSNLWDDGSEGNYWDDFASNPGYPNTYHIPGGVSQDEHPSLNLIPGLSSLSVTAPSRVNESTTFEVVVTSQGSPVEHAMISFSDQTYSTDQNGRATLTAPSVEYLMDHYISVYKEGFNYKILLIMVYDNPPIPEFVIDSPSSIVGGNMFQILVTCNSQPVKHASILFDEKRYLTDMEGKAILLAPIVGENTEMDIQVIQQTLGWGTKTITVLIPSSEPPPTQHLHITVPSNVIEKRPFILTVSIVETTEPISNAEVTFNNEREYTDETGTVTFTAPSVQSNTSYSIVATHPLYEPATTTTTVLNIPQTDNISIQLISPNGNESLQGISDVLWSITASGFLTNYSISIQYQFASGFWVPVVDSFTDGSSYPWNTTLVPDGYPYVLRVQLKEDADLDGVYENLVDEDVSDTPFAIDNTFLHEGWIHGHIVEREENETVPLSGVNVFVILSNEHNVITSKCSLTNESGVYQMQIRAGVYSVVATKTGYNNSIEHNVSIWANETTEVNFTMSRGIAETNLFLFTENREEINLAIKNQMVGGEISIIKKKNTPGYDNYVFIYDTVGIIPTEVKDGYVMLQVTGEQVTLGGKTLIINLDRTLLDSNREITLTYDGKPLEKAKGLSDILNPNDDGAHAEYYISENVEGRQVAVSIPHFSEHAIVISLVPFSGMAVFFFYIFFCLILAVAAIIHMFFIWRR